MKSIYLKPEQALLFVPVKPQPVYIESSGRWLWPKNNAVTASREWWHYMNSLSYAPFLPGEICYVRETWRVGAWNEENYQIAIDYKDGPRKKWLFVEDEELFERLWIESTDDAEKAGIKLNEDDRYEWEPGQSPCRWRSPVTMPQWASRRHVRIVSCEPMRVSEVTWHDAIKAGVEAKYCCSGVDCACMGLPIDNPADDFKENWHKKHPDKQWAWRVVTTNIKGE